MAQIINESFSLLLALSLGIYSYRYMSLFTRLLFFQLLTWIIFYLGSYAVTTYQKSHGLLENNQWLFNIHMLFESSFLTLAAYYYFEDKRTKQIVITLFAFFLLFFFALKYIKGFMQFDNYAQVNEGILITILYALILYKVFNFDLAGWKRSPELWISIGLLIYFACNVPYFSLFNYLNKHKPELSTTLFNLITDLLANVRYLSIAFAFWLVRRNTILTNNELQ